MLRQRQLWVVSVFLENILNLGFHFFGNYNIVNLLSSLYRTKCMYNENEFVIKLVRWINV
jgi:hypothetical protein